MTTVGALHGRDFLGGAAISSAELTALLDDADALKAARIAGERPFPAPLEGRAVALLFDRPSLRTRASFEVGTRWLGGHSVDLSGGGVGLGTRESVADVARVLDRLFDAIVVRTPSGRAVAELAERSGVPVINALTDDEHPCQALADLMTIRERFGRLDGVVLAFVGDGNNVFHSLALLGALAGMEVRIAHPAGYGPRDDVLERARELGGATGARIVVGEDPRRIVAGASVLYTDAWASMGQEAERDVRRRDFRGYSIDAGLLAAAPADAVVMHCLPAHRGEEIADEVIDGPRSVVFDQAENRLHAQNALLAAILGPRPGGGR